jgi:hypothetical protein
MNSVDAIEAASRHLANGLKLVQGVEDIKQRRKLVADDVGRLVGALDKAMESAGADCKPHERAILDIVRTKVVGDVIRMLMQACQWKVEEDKATLAKGGVR